MARLHTRRKADTGPRVVAMPTCSDPDSLAELTVPVDPDRIRKLPGISRPGDIALIVALTGLALLDRRTIPASVLTRITGIAESDLRVALARASGRKGDGSPKFFQTELRGGVVSLSVVMQRILRPDRYVRLSVEALASAPSAAHARLYALAAESAIGDDVKGSKLVSVPFQYLGLDRSEDPESDLVAMVRWAQGEFGDATAGHVLSAGIEGNTVFVMAVNSCTWVYDHRAAPLPWTDADYWERTRLRQKDGVWDGVDLTVDAIRAAKVCEWVRRVGATKVGPRFIRATWLYSLNQALAGNGDKNLSDSILADIRRLGTTEAFERWVVAQAETLTEPTLHMHLRGEEACSLRRIAAANPESPGLRPYATDPVTGEALCYLQYRWRVADPLFEALEKGLISKAEVVNTLRQNKFSYCIGGRESKVYRRPAAVLSQERLKAIAMLCYQKSVQLPDCYGAAIELAKDTAIAAMSGGHGYDSGEEYLLDVLGEEAGRSGVFELRRKWSGTAQDRGALESLIPVKATIEEAAMLFLRDALRETVRVPADD